MGTTPRVDGFPVLRLRRPLRHFLRHWGFVGVSLPSFPLPLASFRKLPVFVMEDADRMMEVACYWLPHPRSAAPQSAARGGQGDRECLGMGHPCFGPYSCPASAISGVTG